MLVNLNAENLKIMIIMLSQYYLYMDMFVQQHTYFLFILHILVYKILEFLLEIIKIFSRFKLNVLASLIQFDINMNI